MTKGYFGSEEETNKAFLMMDTGDGTKEFTYRTGDLASYKEDGQLYFAGRKDFQIKHMGHRIELGEIEINCGLYDGVEAVGCIYDKVKGKIVLFYTGSVEKAELASYLKQRLPRYMQPNKIRQLDEMPHTPNGKLDRKALTALYEGE